MQCIIFLVAAVPVALDWDPCLVFQHYHLCRVVSVLSVPATLKEGLTFPCLIDVVVSELYPQQAAAYLLTKR